MENPLVRMSNKSEEYAVRSNRVEGDVRHLTGNIETQMGRLDEDITFEIPADVTEVRLSGSTNGWYLNDANHPRSWKADVPYPDNELD